MPPILRDKKSVAAAGNSYSAAGDDDINDVAAMGGVNLAEESQRILGSTEMIGTQIRSCKDENFLFTGPLTRRVQEIGKRLVSVFLFLFVFSRLGGCFSFETRSGGY